MSDSEDEGAFASADEGEKGQSKVPSPSDKKSVSDKSEAGNKSAAVPKSKGASGAVPKGKTPTEGSSKPDPKKVKEKQQQKRKGKGGNQQQERQQPNKPVGTVKSTDAEKASPKSSKEQGDDKSSAGNEPKLSAGAKETVEGIGQTPVLPSSEPAMPTPQKKSPVRETGSGDTSEKDAMSKKAGDVRKGIPSNETSPQNQSISREEPQTGENVTSAPADTNPDSGGGGWGWSSWGSSLLSVASNSVQTFKSQVGDGLNTIMDTVESSLGAMDPEDIAREETERKAEAKKSSTVTSQPDEEVEEEAPKTKQESDKDEKEVELDQKQSENEKEKSEGQKESAANDGSGGWFAGWGVAEIAKKVQDTGKSIASKGQTLMTEGFDAVENLAAGGIDVLESIGKKTYTTLSEHDPAFKKTREYLKTRNNKPNLSGILREAKEQAEMEATATKENEEARKAHFGTQFDEFQGIAHLEALEILSNQSEKKVHSLLNSLSSDDLKVIKPILISIKEAFEVDEEGDEADDQKEQDFSGLVSQYVSELELGTAPDKLNKVHAMVKQWMVDFETQESHDGESVKSIHQRAIQSLAELTSKGVEQFHKAGELVLMQRDADKDCKERAHSFARLTGVLCHEIGNLATKFSDCLNKISAQQEDTDEVKTVVTNIYLEATNSSTYIQDAFQLLLPVLQQAAIEHNILSRQS